MGSIKMGDVDSDSDLGTGMAMEWVGGADAGSIKIYASIFLPYFLINLIGGDEKFSCVE